MGDRIADYHSNHMKIVHFDHFEIKYLSKTVKWKMVWLGIDEFQDVASNCLNFSSIMFSFVGFCSGFFSSLKSDDQLNSIPVSLDSEA